VKIFLPSRVQKKKILRWVKIILIIYCLTGIGLYSFQNKLLFRPVAVRRDEPYNFSQPHKEINIPYSDSSNMNIVQFLTDTNNIKGVVLYFHGNRTNISRYAKFASTFTKNGYEVWMLDYPGYGKSTGEFTEQMLYNWALTTYKLARARFSPESIILYGKSLGTGIAAQLAFVRDCKYLLLETPYYSVPSLLAQYAPIYPFEQMIRYKLPVHEYLKKVTAPVVIFHGTDDGVITYRNAKRLKPLLKQGDQFVTIEEGSHNDLTNFSIYQQKMDSLLNH
jgi:uncharacterized protein